MIDKIDIDPLVSSFVDSFLKTAQGLVQKGEEVVPQVMLVARENENPVIIPLVGASVFFESKDGKIKLKGVVKNAWKGISSDKPALKLIAVLVLSDVWIERIATAEWEKMGRKRKMPFAPKPGMAEALMIVASLSDGDVLYQWPYVRGEQEVVFTAEPSVDKNWPGAEGLLVGMWPL